MRPGIETSSIREAFQRGDEVLFPWGDDEREAIPAALADLGTYLAGLAPTASFRGAEGLSADRQTFWVASTGMGSGLHSRKQEIEQLDGDSAGGDAGLEALNRPEVAEPLLIIKQAIDKALLASMAAIGLGDEAMSQQVTVRYRVIRYEPIARPVAGIGLHPDGNLLSGLATNAPGLEVVDRSGVRRPPLDAINVMPGSLLYRWSRGYYRPTFHRVAIPRTNSGQEPTVKVSVAAFLNFPDGARIPRDPQLGQGGVFVNDVDRFKRNDTDPEGDLQELWRALPAVPGHDDLH